MPVLDHGQVMEAVPTHDPRGLRQRYIGRWTPAVTGRFLCDAKPHVARGTPRGLIRLLFQESEYPIAHAPRRRLEEVGFPDFSNTSASRTLEADPDSSLLYDHEHFQLLVRRA